MVRFFRCLVVVVGLVCCTLPARAQQMTAARQACGHDVKTLCAGVQPGGGRILQCLRSHDAQVSAQCKSFLTAAAQQRRGQAGLGAAPGGQAPAGQ